MKSKALTLRVNDRCAALSDAICENGYARVIVRVQGSEIHYTVSERRNHLRIVRKTSAGGIVGERCAKHALRESALGRALASPLVTAAILPCTETPN